MLGDRVRGEGFRVEGFYMIKDYRDVLCNPIILEVCDFSIIKRITRRIDAWNVHLPFRFEPFVRGVNKTSCEC